MKHIKTAPKSEPLTPDTVDFSDEPHTWSWGWAVLLAVCLVLFGAAGFVAYQHTLAGVELSVFHFINGWPDRLRPLFLVITGVPESLWIGVVAVVAAFLLKMYRTAWLFSAAIIAGYATVFIGKHLFGRARPEGLISDAHVRVHETGMGYPSGHTMMITVLVVALWPYLPRGWRWVVALLIPAMALSRVYLGVHSPLDVVGGFAVGAGVVAAIRALPPAARRFLRFD